MSWGDLKFDICSADSNFDNFFFFQQMFSVKAANFMKTNRDNVVHSGHVSWTFWTYILHIFFYNKSDGKCIFSIQVEKTWKDTRLKCIVQSNNLSTIQVVKFLWSWECDRLPNHFSNMSLKILEILYKTIVDRFGGRMSKLEHIIHIHKRTWSTTLQFIHTSACVFLGGGGGGSTCERNPCT